MVLKPEPVIHNTTQFLETCVSIVKNNNIRVDHHVKNYKYYSTHSQLKTLSITDAHSFCPNIQPRNNILNTLHRIQQNCTNNLNIFIATLQYMTIAFNHNYTRAHFNYAFNRIGRTSGNIIWKYIKQISNVWLIKHHRRLFRSLI